MFELGLSDEGQLVQDTARRFATQRLAPRLREHERARGVEAPLVEEFSRLGLATIDLPVALGGQGHGSSFKVLVLEELATVDAGAALALDRLGLAAYALAELGADAEIANSVRRAEFRAGAVEDVEGRLTMTDGTLSGSIPWVAADHLDAAVVLREHDALLVYESIALSPVRVCGLEAAGASELRLREAPIARRIEDGVVLSRIRSRMRLHVAALLVGAARGAAAYATRYATERTAFGRPIAHHQALAFLLVDMATAVDVARVALWRAAATIDRGSDARWEAASALAEAAEQALFVAPSAVQVLGGHGFMKDHPVEKYMRDIRTLAQLVGGRDQAELAAAELVASHEVGLR